MNFTKQQFKSELKDYAVITLGSVVYALAWTFFLLPYHIVSGGVTGLSAIVFYATGIPLQYTYFGINAILLVFALKIIGFRFMTKTIYATFMLSFMLSFTQTLVADENGNLIKLMGEGNDFMSLLIGSIMLGVALAVVFLNNGSTGGTDIIAACINKYKPISLGRVLITVDLCIIGSCLFIPAFGELFQRAQMVVFGLCTMVVMNFMLDYVMNARRESVQFLIFSKKYNEIAKAIGTETSHGITLLDGQGWYSRQETKVLCILTRKRESVAIFRIIKTIDPEAFVSQSSVIGVYGKGFDAIKVKAKKTEENKPA